MPGAEKVYSVQVFLVVASWIEYTSNWLFCWLHRYLFCQLPTKKTHCMQSTQHSIFNNHIFFGCLKTHVAMYWRHALDMARVSELSMQLPSFVIELTVGFHTSILSTILFDNTMSIYINFLLLYWLFLLIIINIVLKIVALFEDC
jgi:hypothetical protein